MRPSNLKAYSQQKKQFTKLNCHLIYRMGENFYKLSKVYFKNSVNLITKQCDLKMDKETQMYRTVFWTLWERERVG